MSIVGINVVAQDGPIAEYHFDENSGTMLGDSSGNNNNGTIHGATWTTGISGSALSFDGINDYVNCGDTLTGNVLSQYTVEAWVYPRNISSQNFIFYDGSDGEFVLLLGSDHSAALSMKIADAEFYWVSYHEMQENQWYHVAGTYNGSHIKIYINGQLKNETTVPDLGLFNPGGAYYPTIGTYSDASDGHRTYYFNGTIDELRVYDRPLSAEEILEHYQEYASNGNGGDTPGFDVWTILLAMVISIVFIKVRRNSK